jgi:hypothetical protein
MNILIIFLYFFISLSTGCFYLVIFRYLKEKPFGKLFVSDRLCIGLMVTVFFSVTFLSSAIIIREVTGPYSPAVSWSVIVVQQFLQLVVIISLLSIQIAQFCNVFFINRLAFSMFYCRHLI